MDNPTFYLEGIVKTRDEMQDFSGPLSLILVFLSKNKIEICDLSISDILRQYLDYIERMQEMDLDIASEFVQMASHLLYIKTRTLIAGEEVEELNELKDSLEQLKCNDIYLSVKAVIPELLSAFQRGSMIFTKQPEPLAAFKDRNYNCSYESYELLASLSSVLARGGNSGSDNNEIVVPKRIIFGVQEKCTQLMELLQINTSKPLRELYRLSRSRSELVATFISVLELCGNGSIVLERQNGELTVMLLNDYNTKPSDIITE